jgi:hypothetical protein
MHFEGQQLLLKSYAGLSGCSVSINLINSDATTFIAMMLTFMMAVATLLLR